MKNLNLIAAGLAFGIVLTLQSGCAETSKVKQTTQKPDSSMPTQSTTKDEAGTPPTKPETIQKSAAEPASAKPASFLAGKVVETMDAGGYTYVNMEKDGNAIWVALPVTKVKVGEEIEVRPGMQMGKFTSKTLNRTFDEILFSAGLVTSAKPMLPAGHQPVGVKPKADQEQPKKAANPHQKGHDMMAKSPKETTVGISGKVVETMDSGGYTYVNLESDGKKAWAAIPVTQVKVGQQLTLLPGYKMDNFTSKSLNRTFDSVIFSGGLLPAAK